MLQGRGWWGRGKDGGVEEEDGGVEEEEGGVEEEDNVGRWLMVWVK